MRLLSFSVKVIDALNNGKLSECCLSFYVVSFIKLDIDHCFLKS